MLNSLYCVKDPATFLKVNAVNRQTHKATKAD